MDILSKSKILIVPAKPGRVFRPRPFYIYCFDSGSKGQVRSLFKVRVANFGKCDSLSMESTLEKEAEQYDKFSIWAAIYQVCFTNLCCPCAVIL